MEQWPYGTPRLAYTSSIPNKRSLYTIGQHNGCVPLVLSGLACYNVRLSSNLKIQRSDTDWITLKYTIDSYVGRAFSTPVAWPNCTGLPNGFTKSLLRALLGCGAFFADKS